MKLGDLTYPEAKDILKQGAVALWPTGSTEAHGPHLPLATDVIIAEETCRRAVERISKELGSQVLQLPPLAFTVTEYASSFSGTLSIPKATAVAYIRDVLVALGGQGVRAICLVNAHLEPEHRFALRDARDQAQPLVPCPVVIADPCDRRWVHTLTDELKSGNCHAGQYETSLVMAARASVKPEQAHLPPVTIDLMAQMKAGQRTFSEMGADQAYFGRPADASQEEGDHTYQKLVDIVVTMLAEALEPT